MNSKQEEEKIELFNFIYGILPSKKREELKNKKKVKVINEFLRERKKLQTAKDNDFARLKQLRKNRSIDAGTYHRLKKIMVLTHEQKRIDLIQSITEKCVRSGKSVNSFDNQPSEDDQPLESNAENSEELSDN